MFILLWAHSIEEVRNGRKQPKLNFISKLNSLKPSKDLYSMVNSIGLVGKTLLLYLMGYANQQLKLRLKFCIFLFASKYDPDIERFSIENMKISLKPSRHLFEVSIKRREVNEILKDLNPHLLQATIFAYFNIMNKIVQDVCLPFLQTNNCNVAKI